MVPVKDDILVSVIIPIYNSDLFLKKCLDSIVNQKFEKYEVICINDMSTDNSKKIIEEYCKKFPFVHLYETGVNSGQAAARNVGLKKAKGKYICFVDSDDYLNDLDVLNILYENAEKTKASAVVFDAETEYEDEECIKYGEPPVISERIEEGIYKGKDYFRLFVNSPVSYVSVWRQFWRRDFIFQNKLFFVKNTAPHEDLVFTFEAFFKSEIVYRLDKRLYRYRCRKNSSMTARNYRKRLKAYIECYKALLDFISSYRDDDNLMEEICRFISWVRQSITEMAVNLVKSGEDLKDFCEGDLFYSIILLDKFHFLNRWISPQEYTALSDSKKILILGCGNTGRDVASMMTLFGINGYSFCVTDSNTDKKKDGVLLINEVKNIEDYIVLIGVSKKYQEEIYDVLKQYKPKQIINLN